MTRTSTLLFTLVSLCGNAAQRDERAGAFFNSTNLTEFKVELADAEVRKLAANAKNYVPGTVHVAGITFENVGIRLKGMGTFEPIYARPSITLKFNWQQPHQQFSGLSKLFLENSDQDASRLCKLIANGAFTDGGIPAPRITQARVELNGRDLGVYVVSEAINKTFLREHFGNDEGNMYEAEFRDINSQLKQENGPAGDQSDLRELCAAARERDQTQRSKNLERLLQTDEVLDFLAIEMIVANWDGYVFQQNNYRIYHDPSSGRMTLIPHDLDNTLSECGMSLMPPRKGILTSALLETREQRTAFRERVARLLPKVLDPERIHERVRCSVSRLTQSRTPEQTAIVQRQAALLEQRIQERWGHLTDELAGKHPTQPVFDNNGVARLTGWTAKTDWNDSVARATVEGGKPCFVVQAAHGYCFASWRLPVWIPVGLYRVEGNARTAGVAGLPSRTGSGAGVRALGNRRGSGVQNSSDWTPVRHEFAVQEDCERVELIAELRAFSGTAWFDPESLKLIRVR